MRGSGCATGRGRSNTSRCAPGTSLRPRWGHGSTRKRRVCGNRPAARGTRASGGRPARSGPRSSASRSASTGGGRNTTRSTR
eukprot:2956580-Alexandrium_andersonii.AAC.1